MKPLFERERPTTLDGVVGQESTVSALKTMLARGMPSGAIYIMGPSGTGKTTIAKALVAELNAHKDDVFEIGGADLTIESVREFIYTFSLSTWGESGWKVLIVNESQALKGQHRTVQSLLPWLENLPAKRLVIFTSSEGLDADIFGGFTDALASRCKLFTLDANIESFANHAAKIAKREGLDGKPIEAYRHLLADCKGNLRAAIQRIESGEMKCTNINTQHSGLTDTKSALLNATAVHCGGNGENSKTFPSSPKVSRREKKVKNALSAEQELARRYALFAEADARRAAQAQAK